MLEPRKEPARRPARAWRAAGPAACGLAFESEQARRSALNCFQNCGQTWPSARRVFSPLASRWSRWVQKVQQAIQRTGTPRNGHPDVPASHSPPAVTLPRAISYSLAGTYDAFWKRHACRMPGLLMRTRCCM